MNVYEVESYDSNFDVAVSLEGKRLKVSRFENVKIGDVVTETQAGVGTVTGTSPTSEVTETTPEVTETPSTPEVTETTPEVTVENASTETSGSILGRIFGGNN